MANHGEHRTHPQNVHDPVMTHHPHVIPLWIYIGVWLALMVGTVLTVAAACVDLGPINIPLMLLIATVKATLVGLFFMHLYYDEKFNLVILIAAFYFVALFFVGTMQDTLTRGAVDPIERHPIAGEMDRAGIVKQPILLDHPPELPIVEGGATTRTAEMVAPGAAHPVLGSPNAH